MVEKSVIASISQAEERHFKTLQLPALRAVVTALTPERRQGFLLLYFQLLYFQLVGSPPIQGENCASMTVIDFRHTAPTRAASSLWQAHGYLPVPICRHSPSQGQTGAVFPLSGLRPAGRAESGSGLPPGSPVIRRRRVRQSRTGALLAPPAQKRGPYFTYPHYSG